MSSISKHLMAVGAGLMLTLAISPGKLAADEWNLMTSFSMNRQVEIPGAILEPNTKYVIQVMDSPSERHVVQVSNEDRSHLISTFFAISDPRLDYPNETRFEYMETRAGHPVPIKTWFYPGHRIGLEFLYPKDQRERIATYTQGAQVASSVTTEIINQTAAVTPVAIPAEEEVKPAAAPEPEPVVQQAQETTPVAAEPAPVQAPEPAPPTVVAQNTPPADVQLPRTAGELPLLGLAGILSLTAGLGIRLFARGS